MRAPELFTALESIRAFAGHEPWVEGSLVPPQVTAEGTELALNELNNATLALAGQVGYDLPSCLQTVVEKATGENPGHTANPKALVTYLELALVALGAGRDELPTGTIRYTLFGGKRMVLDVQAQTFAVNGKALAPWVALTRYYPGEDGVELAGKALLKGQSVALALIAWLAQYTRSANKGQQLEAIETLAVLAARGDEDGAEKGAIYRGLAAYRAANTLAVAHFFQDRLLAPSKDDLAVALAMCHEAGVPAWPHHQAGGLYVGKGAQAMGVGLDGDRVVTFFQADKATKALNRAALLKPCAPMDAEYHEIEASALEFDLE